MKGMLTHYDLHRAKSAVATTLGVVIFSAIIFLTGSCAKQGYPSGGPQDRTPPLVSKATPPNETTDFHAKQFFVEFDEYVVLRDAANNVLVSPPMDPKPEYVNKGRGILVRLRDTLQPNTTYLFQFKEAVADFTEGNVLPSLEYVFSTGGSIDSMTLSGRVVDAQTLTPHKESVTVLLFDTTLDSASFLPPDTTLKPAPRTIAPLYQTRCDKEGHFRFNYIKPGQYRLLAIEDGDKNLLLGIDEPMAFLDTVVTALTMPRTVDSAADTTHATDTLPPAHLLLMSAPDHTAQRVTTSDFTQKGRAIVVTARPMEAPRVESLGDAVVWHLNPSRDTLTLWTRLAATDSLRLVLSDTSGLHDTLRMRYRPVKTPRLSATSATALKIACNCEGSLPYYDTVRLQFSIPVQLHTSDTLPLGALWCLSSDSTTSDTVALRPDSNTLALWDGTLSATADWTPEPGKKYTLRLLPGVLHDLYGQQNDTMVWITKVSQPEQYGNLSVTLTGSTERHIVELLNEKGDVLQRRPASDKVVFPHLKPAKYCLRAFDDRNGNGRWDAGDFYKNLQPERVTYFEKLLDVRANWDFEEKWTIED